MELLHEICKSIIISGNKHADLKMEDPKTDKKASYDHNIITDSKISGYIRHLNS